MDNSEADGVRELDSRVNSSLESTFSAAIEWESSQFKPIHCEGRLHTESKRLKFNASKLDIRYL